MYAFIHPQPPLSFGSCRRYAGGARNHRSHHSSTLVPLFAHYGFLEHVSTVGDPILGRAHRMRLVLDDRHHLQRFKSPFYAMAVRLK
ncbi:MAG: hypothetical protein LZF86_190658 [Nitrospira sp.]|nr:MAG: hypothetical protein LZF86_190658 [Nitrospira sp.]